MVHGRTSCRASRHRRGASCSRSGDQLFSFEFFPPKDDEGEARRSWNSIAARGPGRAVVRVGHLRRRRLDPDRTARVTGGSPPRPPSRRRRTCTYVPATRTQVRQVVAQHVGNGVRKSWPPATRPAARVPPAAHRGRLPLRGGAGRAPAGAATSASACRCCTGTSRAPTSSTTPGCGRQGRGRRRRRDHRHVLRARPLRGAGRARRAARRRDPDHPGPDAATNLGQIDVQAALRRRRPGWLVERRWRTATTRRCSAPPAWRRRPSRPSDLLPPALGLNFYTSYWLMVTSEIYRTL